MHFDLKKCPCVPDAFLYTEGMTSYRTVKFAWLPSTCQGWLIYTSVRKEAARLWSWLVERHATIRQLGGKWPTKAAWRLEIKGLFPGLHSQSVQMILDDFLEAIASAESLRKRGEPYEYPMRKTTYRQVLFSNQAPRFRDGRMVLPCGQAGSLEIHMPRGVTLPGRMMEVRLGYGSVEIVCEVIIGPQPPGPTIGVDLGVNTIIAATDGDTAVLVNGREIKATVQLRNKRLAEIAKEAVAAQERVATTSHGSSDANTGSWTTRGTRSATCATRRPARLRTPSRTPRRTSVSRSTTPAARWIGSAHRTCRRPATARSSECCTTSSVPASRSRKHTRRRRAPSAANGRSTAGPIGAVGVGMKPPATSWDAPTSAPSASRAACDRVVLYRTGSISCTLPSILASAR